jgi:F0F1-type ATP synthase membrane subunit c/vacuolar-type H+-ATPase subunit K
MSDENPGPVQRYNAMMITWVSLIMSQVMFLFVIFLTRPELFRFEFTEPLAGNSSAQILGFGVAAITTFLFSFGFKKRFLERAVEQQDPEVVQTGYLIALALCEASSLLGFVLAFAFEYQYFFLWFALGILGTLLHFPRRDDILAASYRRDQPQ